MTDHWNRILDEVIGPNAEAIARVVIDGTIAIVVHNPQHAAIDTMARSLGWHGAVAVLPLPDDRRKRLIRALKAACARKEVA